MYTVDINKQVFGAAFKQISRPTVEDTKNHDNLLSPSPSFDSRFREVASIVRA